MCPNQLQRGLLNDAGSTQNTGIDARKRASHFCRLLPLWETRRANHKASKPRANCAVGDKKKPRFRILLKILDWPNSPTATGVWVSRTTEDVSKRCATPLSYSPSLYLDMKRTGLRFLHGQTGRELSSFA
jgi:hypothetical protein